MRIVSIATREFHRDVMRPCTKSSEEASGMLSKALATPLVTAEYRRVFPGNRSVCASLIQDSETRRLQLPSCQGCVACDAFLLLVSGQSLQWSMGAR